ncbi:hypothetical protein L1887_31157 [Cichorium endivia]|nr:hypothetical protein L1887_31157 [Cichorium endivia]
MRVTYTHKAENTSTYMYRRRKEASDFSEVEKKSFHAVLSEEGVEVEMLSEESVGLDRGGLRSRKVNTLSIHPYCTTLLLWHCFFTLSISHTHTHTPRAQTNDTEPPTLRERERERERGLNSSKNPLKSIIGKKKKTKFVGVLT